MEKLCIPFDGYILPEQKSSPRADEALGLVLHFGCIFCLEGHLDGSGDLSVLSLLGSGVGEVVCISPCELEGSTRDEGAGLDSGVRAKLDLGAIDYLFSKSGFSDDLSALASVSDDLRLFTLDDILGLSQ